jgi:VCBS repeat-containing protein
LSAITAQSAIEGDSTKTTGVLTGSDVDANDQLTFAVPTVDGFILKQDGSYSFDPGHSSYNHLAQGDVQTITIPVTVTDLAGATDTKNLVITLTGTNDAPVLQQIQAKSVTEDGQLLTGQLTATDPDDHEVARYSVTQHVDGFTLHADGSYSFDPSHGSYQHLAAGQVQTLTIPVGVIDQSGATDTQTITITVHGKDDTAVVTGTDTGAVTEGDIGDTTVITGNLSISDVDQGQSPSFADVTSVATTYGHIAMVNGQWSYTLDQSKVQGLSPSDPDPDKQQVVDTHTFTSTDGSTQQVSITITGTEDKPVISSAYASPLGATSTLSMTSLEVVASANPSVIDTTADWGSQTSTTSSGLKIVGLYMPGSSHNELTSGNEPTLSTSHSGQGGFARIDSHGWWQSHHIPNTVNTGSGGAAGTGNAWEHGIVEFSDGTLGIINRVCDGAASGEVDYLYFSTYQQLHVGANVLSGSGVAGETIHIVEGTTTVATTVVDAHGHFQVGIAGLPNGQHTLSVTNDNGETSAPHIYDVNSAGIADISPAGLTADLKEDSAQFEVKGELKATDLDDIDQPEFTPQVQQQTAYGVFSIDSAGHYHYELDNHNSAVNQLGVHQTIQEKIPVIATTLDGEQVISNVVITIHGSVDAPILSATTHLVQQGAEIPLDLHTTIIDTGGDTETLTVKISGLPDQATLNHGNYNALSKIWTVDKADLQDLKADLQNPNFHGDIALTITAIASAGGEVQHTTRPLTLSVNAQPEVLSPLTDQLTEDNATHGVDLLQSASDKDTGDVLHVSQLSYELDGAAASPNIPAGFALAADGHTITVAPSNAAFQHLVAGASTTLIISYQVNDSRGGAVVQTSSITITGTNDAATISGVSTGQVVEDDGQLATGQLHIVDKDDGESSFKPETVVGTFGTAHIDVGGHWTYVPDNVKSQSLLGGQVEHELLTVHSADGTAHQLNITVTGTNDLPVISGASTGAVIEAGDGISGNADATGTLNVTDPDIGDTLSWQVVQGQGSYGQLSIDQQGQWYYQLDNTHHATDALAANQQVTEHFTVTATDSSGSAVQQTITIDVTGTNDAPEIMAISAQAAIEGDSTLTKGLIYVIESDNHDRVRFSSPSVDGFVLKQDGSYSFDPSHSSYNHLAQGDVQTITIPITLTDLAGATDTKNLVISLTGTNDAPVLQQIQAQSATEDGQVLTGQFTSVDADDHEVAHYSVLQKIDGFTLHADGSYNFDPSHASYQHLAAGQDQTLTIPVVVFDQSGATDTKNLTITVHGQDEYTPPAISIDVDIANGGLVPQVGIIGGPSVASYEYDLDISVHTQPGESVDSIALTKLPSGISLIYDNGSSVPQNHNGYLVDPQQADHIKLVSDHALTANNSGFETTVVTTDAASGMRTTSAIDAQGQTHVTTTPLVSHDEADMDSVIEDVVIDGSPILSGDNYADEPQLNLMALRDHNMRDMQPSLQESDGITARAKAVLGNASENEANDELQNLIEEHLNTHHQLKSDAVRSSGADSMASAEVNNAASSDAYSDVAKEPSEDGIGGSSSSHMESLVPKPDDDTLPPI